MKKLSLLTGTIFLLIFAVAGCKRIESITNQKLPASANVQASTLPDGAIAIDVDGQALSHHQSEVDLRVRTAAILDGLRNFARDNSPTTDVAARGDTVIAMRNWDGIEILGITIQHNGIIHVDSVVVNVVNFQNDKPVSLRWKSQNMTLVEPDSTHDLNFEDLIGSLKARGIEVKRSRPIGRGLWQESLSIRHWEKR